MAKILNTGIIVIDREGERLEEEEELIANGIFSSKKGKTRNALKRGCQNLNAFFTNMANNIAAKAAEGRKKERSQVKRGLLLFLATHTTQSRTRQEKTLSFFLFFLLRKAIDQWTKLRRRRRNEANRQRASKRRRTILVPALSLSLSNTHSLTYIFMRVAEGTKRQVEWRFAGGTDRWIDRPTDCSTAAGRRNEA